MKDRIRKIRKHFDLTQEKFGERLGLKQNSIALIESGKNNTSDTTIKLICKEFDVNEEWLRTGNGQMFNRPDEDFITMSAKIEKDGDDFIKELTKTLWALDKEELLVLKSIITKIKNNPNL